VLINSDSAFLKDWRLANDEGSLTGRYYILFLSTAMK